MSAPASPAVTCRGCLVRDQRLQQLAAANAALQAQLRQRMSKRQLAILTALEGSPGMSAAELAKKVKGTAAAVTTTCSALRKRGLVHRVGWRDVPGHFWPEQIFATVPATPPAPQNGAAKP